LIVDIDAYLFPFSNKFLKNWQRWILVLNDGIILLMIVKVRKKNIMGAQNYGTAKGKKKEKINCSKLQS
jgi:hypothetical protein